MKKKKEKPMDKTVSGWLYGWKDMANYIGCSVKQVQRYAKEYRFPVIRLPVNKPAADPNEIDKWVRKKMS